MAKMPPIVSGEAPAFIPQWDPTACIQCGNCLAICSHAGKVKFDSADKSDTVSFAKNAVSEELGENRAGADACSPKKIRTPRFRRTHAAGFLV